MIEEKEESQKSSDKTPEKSNRLINENKDINVGKTVDLQSKEKELKEKNFQPNKSFSEQDYGEKKGEDLHSASPKNEQDNQKEESNSYRRFLHMSEQWLQDEDQKRIERDLKIANNKDEHLTDEIEQLYNDLKCVSYGDQRNALNNQLKAALKQRHDCRQEREDLDKKRQEIRNELKRRKKEGNESTEHYQSVSAESLLIENEPIENTVLYVATFFVELSLSDFKRVVSEFLRGRTVSITKSQTVIEDGNSKTIETQEEQSLVKKWEESIQEAHQADKTLKKCYLKVFRKKDYKLVVDFLSPDLRKEFIRYFHTEQAFYIEEQYKRVQELLFDRSEDIANNVINLLGEAAIYYPNDYGSDWLLKITLLSEEINSVLRFGRISELIFQMQINLEPAESQTIIKGFLDELLKQKKDYVFIITFYLIYRQLRFSYLLKDKSSSKQLLDWLKQVLDEEEEEKEQKDNAYSVLDWLLKQTYSYEYIYDILELLKAWLPEPELPREKYSLSNKAVIILLVSYCEVTIKILPTKDYGSWPSNYPLFKSVHDDSDVDSSLNLLISLLFYPSGKQGLAINYVFTDEIVAMQFIGYFIAEWFTILYGLQKDKPTPETLKIADSLLRQVIMIARKSEQKRLTEYWASLATSYLEQATNCANDKTKKELVFRRKLVKELRNRFNVLQQENLTVG